MSIYVQLLSAALAEAPPLSDETAAGAVSELLCRRADLYTRGSSHAGPIRAPDAVAYELAYDMALIRLARLLGMECEAGDFDLPGRGRARVELSLVSKGIRLGESNPSKATS
jgi:hypothetical protein